MPKNKMIIIRVSKLQYERIVNNAQAKGHKTVSNYIRSIALGFDMLTETKIQKIFEAVVENDQGLPRPAVERPLSHYLQI